MNRALLAFTLLLLAPLVALGQKDPVSRSWNQPVAPFRIAGNLYYVGASDITSYLIATPKGLILIDGGFEETAPMIRQNVATLGFDYKDIKIILNSHAHYDHVGGIDAIRRETGARFLSSAGDAPLLARGGKDDPQFGDRFLYPPIEPDALIRDGGHVTLGGTTLTAHLTPGHTKGCITWTMTVREHGKPLHVVFVGSASVPSEYKLAGNPLYPNAIADYRHTFAVLKSLPCDIFLASHGNFFDLQGKLARHASFVDPKGYREYVAASEQRFEKRLPSS
jgi:metallo-beta-lactamase class B